MSCLSWDVFCQLGEALASALAFLWFAIQAMFFIFGFAIVFYISRMAYKGKFWEANILVGLWAGYVAYRLALLLAIAGVVVGVVVVLLAIFTPFVGIAATFILNKLQNQQPQKRPRRRR